LHGSTFELTHEAVTSSGTFSCLLSATKVGGGGAYDGEGAGLFARVGFDGFAGGAFGPDSINVVVVGG
jgi:hypothetical protein